MSETGPGNDKRGDEPVERIRTKEPQPPFGSDEVVPDPDTLSDDDATDPVPGGYQDRDPKSEMPIIPTVQSTAEDPGAHDAAPDDKERWASE